VIQQETTSFSNQSLLRTWQN